MQDSPPKNELSSAKVRDLAPGTQQAAEEMVRRFPGDVGLRSSAPSYEAQRETLIANLVLKIAHSPSVSQSIHPTALQTGSPASLG